MYDELKNTKNRIVGLKQLLRALESDSVSCIYLAADADEHVKQKVATAAKGKQATIKEVASMSDLGEVCGIEVSAACAAILQESQ